MSNVDENVKKKVRFEMNIRSLERDKFLKGSASDTGGSERDRDRKKD